MNVSARITEFIVSSSIAVGGRPAFALGLVLDGRAAVWQPFLPPPDMPPAFDLDRVSAELLRPLLHDRQLSAFHEIEAEMAALRETVTYMAPVTPESEAGVSRRGLLSGELDPRQPHQLPPVSAEEVTVTRPLPPALCFALSRLLVSATAFSWRQTTASALAVLFDIQPAWRWVGICAAADFGTRLSRQLMPYPLEALAIRFKETDFNGDRQLLHGHLDQLQQFMQLDAAHNPRMALHVHTTPDLQRCLAGSADEMVALFKGLKLLAQKRPLRFFDPLQHHDRQQWATEMGQLKKSLAIIEVAVQIGAGGMVDSMETIEALIAAQGADMLLLDGVRLGTLTVLVDAARVCRAMGRSVLLAAGGDDGRFLGSLALALQPELVQAPRLPSLSVGLSTLYNEMAQALTGISITG